VCVCSLVICIANARTAVFARFSSWLAERGRLPLLNDPTEANQVLQLAKMLNDVNKNFPKGRC